MESSLQDVALADLGDTIGVSPSTRLRESVKRMGVIQPVLIARQADDDGEIKLVVVDGNRRIAAARAANMTHVPAIVFDDLTQTAVAEATLVTNGFRTANYLAEFWAMKQLERERYSYNDIVSVTGLGSSSIKLRNSLTDLHRDLLVALRNGKIGQTEAAAAGKLSRPLQEQLVDRFRRNGKLTRDDIKEFSDDPKPAPKPKPTTTEALTDELGSIVSAAPGLGFNKADFLEMVGRIWDDVNT